MNREYVFPALLIGGLLVLAVWRGELSGPKTHPYEDGKLYIYIDQQFLPPRFVDLDDPTPADLGD